jgi:uncharacterized membrane protein
MHHSGEAFGRLVGLALCVWLASCSRDPQQKPVQTEPADADAAATGTAESPQADSGLAIKRGVMTLAEDRATFRPCDGKAEWWVLDQSPGALTQTLIEQAQSSPASLYVEAYGERAPVDDEPKAKGFEGVFVLEEVLYAGVPGDLRGCDAPAATYVVSARGNEPFWSIEVRDAEMVWKQPEAPQEITFRDPQTINAEGAVRYAASTPEHRLELMVHAQPCRDSMSGEYFAYTAKAILNERELSGCARVGR